MLIEPWIFWLMLIGDVLGALIVIWLIKTLSGVMRGFGG